MENLLIEIPEDVAAHLRLPPRNVKQELKKDWLFTCMPKGSSLKHARVLWLV
jgi:hypothetical protein